MPETVFMNSTFVTCFVAGNSNTNRVLVEASLANFAPTNVSVHFWSGSFVPGAAAPGKFVSCAEVEADAPLQ